MTAPATVTVDLATIEGDLKTAVIDAQALLTLVEKLEFLLPAAYTTYITQAQNVLTVIESLEAQLKI